MTGFKPQTSAVRSNYSTKWFTTTALKAYFGISLFVTLHELKTLTSNYWTAVVCNDTSKWVVPPIPFVCCLALQNLRRHMFCTSHYFKYRGQLVPDQGSELFTRQLQNTKLLAVSITIILLLNCQQYDQIGVFLGDKFSFKSSLNLCWFPGLFGKM